MSALVLGFLYWLITRTPVLVAPGSRGPGSQFGFLFGLTNVCWLGSDPRGISPMHLVSSPQQGYSRLFWTKFEYSKVVERQRFLVCSVLCVSLH